MKYFQPLNIPSDYFDKERIYKELEIYFNPNKVSVWKHWGEHTDLLNDEFHLWLKDLGCKVFFAEVFYTPPNTNMIWHIDTQTQSDFVKINFVWGSTNHLMQWGRLKTPKPITPNVTLAGTKFLEFKDYEVEVVESTTIKTPTVVKIGVPHRVVNRDTSGRWCLSANIHDQHGNRLTIDQASQVFSVYALG